MLIYYCTDVFENIYRQSRSNTVKKSNNGL